MDDADGHQNGNGNCINVVALNIAQEMISDETDEQTNDCSSEKSENTISPGGDQCEENEQTYPSCITPVQRSSSASCVSTDSVGSFTGQAENSLQFVEYQPTTAYPVQQPVPYYLYNGQLYNATAFYPFGQPMSPYSQYDNNNFSYYQMQPDVAVGYGNMVYTTSQENFSNTSYSIETGSDEEINNSTTNPTDRTPDNVINSVTEAQTQTEIDHTANQDKELQDPNTPSMQSTRSGSQNAPTGEASYINSSYNLNQPNIPVYNDGNLAEHQTPYNIVYPQTNPSWNSIHSGNPYQQLDHQISYQNDFHSQAANKQMFQYPAIYVSTTGLITVLMKYDVSVETTVEQTLRMVSHQQKLVVAINSRGNASYLFHPAAHIMQDLTTTEAEIFLGRRVKMTTSNITFANNFHCYRFDYARIDNANPEFTDLSKDKSVHFLFSDSQSNPEILNQCSDIISKAEFERNSKGGICIRINGFKIIQTAKGDVIVTGKGKYMRMSPTSSVLRLDTNFVQMDVEMNWNVRIKRGAHSVNASHLGFVVSNGKVEAAFDEQNKVHAYKLPSRRPLLIGGIIGQNRREMERNDN